MSTQAIEKLIRKLRFQQAEDRASRLAFVHIEITEAELAKLQSAEQLKSLVLKKVKASLDE